jgi:hypothetical protein
MLADLVRHVDGLMVAVVVVCGGVLAWCWVSAGSPVEKTETRAPWVARPSGHLTLEGPARRAPGLLARIRLRRKAARS